MAFVHLHCHSEYSLLDGASKVADLCDRVAAIGQTAVAITDHGWMAAAVKFVTEAERVGIKPIVGSEVYVCKSGTMDDKAASPGDNYHLTLLAQNEEGYRNLVWLTSMAHIRGLHYKPRIDLPTLKERSGGLILLSGCIAGQLNQHIIEGHEKKARRLIDWYADVFGDRFFLEVMYHGCDKHGHDIVRELDDQGNVKIEEYELAAWIADQGERRGIPVVATNDAHYLTRDDGDAHDTLLCMGMGAWKTKTDRIRYPGFDEGLFEFYVKDEPEMLEASPDDSYWVEACANTQVVADMIEPKVVPAGKMYLPVYQVPRDVGYRVWKQTRTLI
jgi:DNA polymerase-3 subunit alpha